MLSFQEKLDLKRLVSESECGDNTDQIRKLKHSTKIHEDLERLAAFLDESGRDSRMEVGEFEQAAKNTAPFLVSHYPDLFMRAMKRELSMEIMGQLLQILGDVEEGRVDQHEGSVLVGKILKSLYLDSAIRRGNHLDQEHAAAETRPTKETKPISWSTYKIQHLHVDT